jgi:hypothetical protein
MGDRTVRDECIDDAVAELIRDDLDAFLLVTKHGDDCTVEHYAPGTVEGAPTIPMYPLLLAAGVNHICSLSAATTEDILTGVIHAGEHHFGEEFTALSYPDGTE